MTAPFVWRDDPIRHLRDWAAQQTYRRIELAETQGVGATTSWRCEAHDLEPCPQRHNRRIEYVARGTGQTAADAAYECLTQLLFHAVQDA